MQIGAIIFIIGAILCAASVDIAMLILGRVLCGLAVGKAYEDLLCSVKLSDGIRYVHFNWADIPG